LLLLFVLFIGSPELGVKVWVENNEVVGVVVVAAAGAGGLKKLSIEFVLADLLSVLVAALAANNGLDAPNMLEVLVDWLPKENFGVSFVLMVVPKIGCAALFSVAVVVVVVVAVVMVVGVIVDVEGSWKKFGVGFVVGCVGVVKLPEVDPKLSGAAVASADLVAG